MEDLIKLLKVKTIKEEKYKDKIEEFIDSDGGVISGGESEDPSKIITNPPKSHGRPQTTDDFEKETGQGDNWYYRYRGFAVTESEEIDKNESLIELLTKNSDDYDIQNQNVEIPDYDELKVAYNEVDLHHTLQSMLDQLNSLNSEDENTGDIEAIVLKALLNNIDFSNLNSNHKKELKNLIR